MNQAELSLNPTLLRHMVVEEVMEQTGSLPRKGKSSDDKLRKCSSDRDQSVQGGLLVRAVGKTALEKREEPVCQRSGGEWPGCAQPRQRPQR